MATIAVIDYGMGNIRSVSKALEYVGGDAQVIVTYDSERIGQADRVVLPGVGALRDCMSELRRLELIDVLLECMRTKPFLGICLGMQALLEGSEENEGTPGMGVVAGRVVRFAAPAEAGARERLKIPHMGWNRVHQTRSHPLWADIPQDSYFYFVHSYYVEPRDDELVAGTADYGVAFAAALARDNIFAVQFHPEKSQQAGLRLLANFAVWDGSAS